MIRANFCEVVGNHFATIKRQQLSPPEHGEIDRARIGELPLAVTFHNGGKSFRDSSVFACLHPSFNTFDQTGAC